MQDQITAISKEFESALSELEDVTEMTALKQAFLGKKGSVSTLMSQLKDLDPEERKAVGGQLHSLRQEIEKKLSSFRDELERKQVNEKLEASWEDPSRRGSLFDWGLAEAGLHPMSQILNETLEIFTSMGFEVLDGPHIEDELHNFTALNIPESHPARDLQDTFWFEDGKHLLRTHTSGLQIRGMKDRTPPVKFIGPGGVFRCERTDQWHDFAFFQLEGLLIDKGVSVAHLLYFAKTLFQELFRTEVEIRTRPSYFPFVEPGLEIDMRRDGGKWVEMLGSGMIHPNVLKHMGVDPDVYSGFAFGIGLDRLLLMRYGVEDIRHLRSGDLRFVKQFASYSSGGEPC